MKAFGRSWSSKVFFMNMPEPHTNQPEPAKSEEKKSLRQAATGLVNSQGSSESGLLVTLGKIAGIGGISIGVLFLLFLNLIRQKFLPNLDPNQAYNLLLLFMLFTFGIASAGVAVWASQIKAGRTVVVLLLIFTLGMSVLGAYVIRGAKEEAKTNTPASRHYVVPESIGLQQRDDARQAFKTTHTKFRFGVDTLPNLIRAHEKLIETEIVLSTTREEKIAVYRQALETAKELETEVENMIKDGALATNDIYEVRRHRTETEVSLAKEQSASE
jgi:ABC-type transport system involved in multi-copper enzyme maturation permease subunit